MKGNVIMGQRQKETLSPNNYFGGKGVDWRGYNWDQDIFPGKLCPYRIPCPTMWSWGPALIGRAVALIWWRLVKARRQRKWQDGFPQSHPSEKKTLINWGSDDISMYVCARIFIKKLRSWTAPLFTFVAACGSVFVHTTGALRLWPLTSRRPRGLCLSDLTSSDWPSDHLTVCFSDIVLFCDALGGCWLQSRLV